MVLILVHYVVQDKVISFLDELSNDSLKKEATSEAKSDTFSSIMKVKHTDCYVGGMKYQNNSPSLTNKKSVVHFAMLVIGYKQNIEIYEVEHLVLWKGD